MKEIEWFGKKIRKKKEAEKKKRKEKEDKRMSPIDEAWLIRHHAAQQASFTRLFFFEKSQKNCFF